MGVLDGGTLITVALAAVALVFAYLYYMTWHFGIFIRLGIKGPKPTPVFGNLFTLLSKGGHVYDAELYAQHKKDGFFGTFEMRLPVLIVTDLEVIKDITIKHFNNFPDHRHFEGLDSFPSTHFLTMMTGDHWKHVRNSLTPAFSSGKLKRMMPVIQDCCDELRTVLQKAADDGNEIEMKKVIGAFTMDVIARTGFGLQTDTQKDPENQFVESANAFLNVQGTIIFFCMLLPFLAPILNWFKFQPVSRKHIDFFCDVTRHALKERRSDTTGKYNDLIQLMANAEVDLDAEVDTDIDHRESLTTSTRWTSKGLTIEDITGSGIVFMVGGYETTATSVCFTLYELALHPECLAKVQKEIDDKLKGAKPTPESLSQLTYLEMCFNETLRLYPPAFRTDRMCVKDTVVHGVTIPKGMVVGIPIAAIHKDPELWPDPETFLPERFAPEARAYRHPMSFLAFGSGPRNCIGMRLAHIEAKMALATILQKFSPVPGEKTEIPIKLKKFGITGPENGFWLKIKERD